MCLHHAWLTSYRVYQRSYQTESVLLLCIKLRKGDEICIFGIALLFTSCQRQRKICSHDCYCMSVSFCVDQAVAKQVDQWAPPIPRKFSFHIEKFSRAPIHHRQSVKTGHRLGIDMFQTKTIKLWLGISIIFVNPVYA